MPQFAAFDLVVHCLLASYKMVVIMQTDLTLLLVDTICAKNLCPGPNCPASMQHNFNDKYFFN